MPTAAAGLALFFCPETGSLDTTRCRKTEEGAEPTTPRRIRGTLDATPSIGIGDAYAVMLRSPPGGHSDNRGRKLTARRTHFPSRPADMTSFVIGGIIFACVLAGALGGMFLRTLVPEHHLTKETEDAVKAGMSMIATLAALVIGLLVASAKSSFDTKDAELRQFSVNLILLDRQLVHYGPEAREARDLLRRYAVYKIDSTWSDEASHRVDDPDGWMLLEDVQDKLRTLAPRDDAQRWLQARALQISTDLASTRWLLDVQKGTAIRIPFLVILVFWLTTIFTSFGVFAPRHATMITALCVCSFSVAGALFLILEMDQPFGGLVQISSAPMREALAHLSR